MKLLVTGGEGFIGRNLRLSFENKYEITSPQKEELDLTNKQQVDFFFKKNRFFDVIIHCASSGTILRKEEEEVFSKNIQMFNNLTNNKKHFKKMIFLGSGGEYDKTKPIVDINEEEFGRTIPIDSYSYSKFKCSEYILKNQDIINLRLFAVFGKYEDYKYRFISNSIYKSLIGEPISINQNVFFDYLYIKDLMKIIDFFILNNAKYKFYNIGSGEKIDLVSIAKVVKQITNNPNEIIIKQQGLNNEYTCNISRLKQEYSTLTFTPLIQAIEEVYEWLKGDIQKNKD